MAILGNILNAFGDCDTSRRGTGLPECIEKEGDVVGILHIKRSWKELTTVDFTEELYKGYVQSQTINPFMNIYNFTQDTPDNERSTGSTGLLSDIRKGKPQYTFTYDKGYAFHKNLYDFDGKSGNIGLIFNNGVLFASNVAGTEVKGFDMNLFSVDTYKFKQGGDPNMSTVMVQFSNAEELNSRGVFMTWESLGFDISLVNGVMNAQLTYNTTPVAGTELQVKVVADANTSVNVLGLDAASHWGLRGTQTTTAAVTDAVYNSNGYYVLTLDNATVSTDTVQPYLRDLTDEVAENASGDLWKGQAPLATIA